MAASAEHKNFLEMLARRWLDFREHQADLDAVSHMNRFEFEQLAADVGVTGSELAEAIDHGAGASELLDRMLAARGLDRHEIAEREPAALLEIESMCSRCQHKHRCAHELDAGTAIAHADRFCPNALVLAALSREMGHSSRSTG